MRFAKKTLLKKHSERIPCGLLRGKRTNYKKTTSSIWKILRTLAREASIRHLKVLKRPYLRTIRYLFEYLIFLFFSFWIPWLTRPQVFQLSRLIGKTAYYFLPGRRDIAKINLGIAFPDLSEKQKKAIVVNSFGNVALGILYMIWLKKISRETVDSIVEVDNESLDYLKKAFEKGKGVLLLVGHFGNWELLGLSYGLNDLPPMNGIARKLDNPFLEKRLLKFRTATGNRVIYKANATREVIRSLKRNECSPILIDQNMGKNPIFVDFFGEKAATTRTLASLALSSGAPIIPGTSFPLKNGRFHSVYGQEITIKKTGDKKKDVHLLTQKCTDFLEERIRECPEGWMWGHRRWKKRPPGEPPVYQAKNAK